MINHPANGEWKNGGNSVQKIFKKIIQYAPFYAKTAPFYDKILLMMICGSVAAAI